jgi:hypothetical protein
MRTVANSRGPGKRDDMVAERANPRDAQLGERDAFTIRYGRQAIYEPEFTSDTLGAVVVSVREGWRTKEWLRHLGKD